MECIQPGTIRDEELIAYLAGEKVQPTVTQHLAVCSYCASQLATYRRIELKLTSKLYRWDCPPNHVLGEYQLGLLSSEQVAEVKNHLRWCVLCASELVTLTEFLSNDPVLVEPIPAVQKHVTAQPALNSHRPAQDAKRLLDQWRDRSLAGARRIIATLLPPQPRLAYQRDGAASTASWPRRYSAEDISILIQVERGSMRKGSLQVIGFVTRKGTTLGALQGTAVQLLSQDKAYTQNIDELGNFIFSSVAPATYTLELQFPEGIVVIEELSVTVQD